MPSNPYIDESNRLLRQWEECWHDIRDNLRDPSKIEELRKSIARASDLAEQRYDSRIKALALAAQQDSSVIIKDRGDIVTKEAVTANLREMQDIMNAFEQKVNGLAERKAKREALIPIMKETNRRFHELISQIKNELENLGDSSAVVHWIKECRQLDQSWRDATIEFIENKGIRKYKAIGDRTATEADIIDLYNKSQAELDQYERRLAIAVGHARQKHGHLDIIGLDQRLQTEQKVQASSFATDSQLEVFILKTIEDWQSEIDQWLTGSDRTLPIYYEDEDIQSILLSKEPGHSSLQFPTALKVVLVRDNSLPTGYSVLTAYLEE